MRACIGRIRTTATITNESNCTLREQAGVGIACDVKLTNITQSVPSLEITKRNGSMCGGNAGCELVQNHRMSKQSTQSISTIRSGQCRLEQRTASSVSYPQQSGTSRRVHRP